MIFLFFSYLWREASVNHRWILRTVLIAQIICVLFFVQGFTSSAVAQQLHQVQGLFAYGLHYEELIEIGTIPVGIAEIRTIMPIDCITYTDKRADVFFYSTSIHFSFLRKQLVQMFW